MGPNINTFIMEHEETFKDFFWVVEVDSISMSDGVIVLHVRWGISIVSYVLDGFFKSLRGQLMDGIGELFHVCNCYFCSNSKYGISIGKMNKFNY